MNAKEKGDSDYLCAKVTNARNAPTRTRTLTLTPTPTPTLTLTLTRTQNLTLTLTLRCARVRRDAAGDEAALQVRVEKG